VENDTTAPKEQEETARAPTLKLTDIEGVIREHAKPIAASYQVKTRNYRIHLVTKSRGIMVMKRGPVVQIYLLWPDAGPQINTLLKEAFRIIKTRPMIDSWAVEPMAMVLKRKEERREWFRETFGDENEILADLLPRIRTRARTETRYTYSLTDRDTGISVSIEYTGERDSWDVEQEARIKLSRIVRAFEVSQLEKEEPRAEPATADAGEQASA
jgi:hypothetical protein